MLQTAIKISFKLFDQAPDNLILKSFDISYKDDVLNVGAIATKEYFAYGTFNITNNFSTIVGKSYNLF